MATSMQPTIADGAQRARRTTLYDSSDSTGGCVSRSGRARSMSTSSAASQSLSSTSSSSLSSIDSEEVKNIFTSYHNVSVTGSQISQPAPPPTHKITFGVRPWVQRAAQHAQAAADAGEQLNPKAAAFVPGNGVRAAKPPSPQLETVYYDEDSEDDLGSTYYPDEGQHLSRPPGLSVPSGLRTPTNALQTVQQLYAQYPEDPNMPPWARYFMVGSSAPAGYDPAMRDLTANALVSSLPQWSDEELMFFASQFPSKAYSSTEAGEHPVALFAFAVYNAFGMVHGDIAAQAFLWSLRQHSIFAFTNAWSIESLDPAVHREAGGLTGHVMSSIYLARFIGDLFNQGLLSKEHVLVCIAKLFENPQSEEHIAALGHLVTQAGAELWMSEPMRLERNEFEQFMMRLGRAAMAARMTLVENNTQPPGYCRIWLDKVRIAYEDWAAYYSEVEYRW